MQQLKMDQSDVRIVLVGAGSANFGRGTIADIMSSETLRDLDCTVILVDTDQEALDKTYALAGKIADHYNSTAGLEKTVERRDALPGADFVVISVAIKRYELWEQDYRVPLSYGFRHVLGENGGPGALFHTLRNYELVIPICRDIESLCPEALVLNYTNPESRIVMGISQLTGVGAVGLCHGVLQARESIARILGRDLADLDIVTGGINHFFWALKVRDAGSGEDLYPLLRERAPPSTPPLARRMLGLFDYYTFPSDDHIGEYLSFAHEYVEPRWPYGRESKAVPRSAPADLDWRDDYLTGRRPVDRELVAPSAEIGVDIIADVLEGEGSWEPAVNVPNADGYVENLPRDAVVEVPALVDSKGVHPLQVGPLPEPLAALCRQQITVQRLIVEAYRERSRDLLLQALLLDPVVDSTKRAEEMLDYMLDLQTEYLPAFD